MEQTFKYRCDRRTIYWTVLYMLCYIGLGVCLYFLYEGGYFSAWFATCVGALLVLMALSIPRKLIVSDETIEVRCLLDMTEIAREEIASVRRVKPRELRWLIPFFGGCGFFGYYGHFFDLRHAEHLVIYASEWRNMVEITTIYDDRLLVSCAEPETLIGLLLSENDTATEQAN